ncbi:MAG: ribulose phosphate epimerase [Nannocystaceae bacterium]|nr:ribulose phosphate epimerase [Myxococcales bacterium]
MAGSLGLACGDDSGETNAQPTTAGSDGQTSTTDGTTANVSDSGSTTDPSGTESSSSDSSTSETTTDPTTSSSSSDTDCEFVCETDMPGGTVECDIWAQDCPEGQKCMPWANDGGNSWNSTKCSDVQDNAGDKGDECTVEGSGVSGDDSCGLGLFCYYIDQETGVGTCIEMCQGSPEAAMCDPGEVCAIANDGVLILCRPKCDPTLQDCEYPNTGCLPAANSNDFTCIIDASGQDAGAYGDPCEFINSCDPGLFCANADAVPDCQASGCCTLFCDINEADMCPEGTQCTAWFEEGQAPPDYEHVGGCVIPA